MNDVTVIVPAWKRPHYLSQALGSWTAARGFGDVYKVAVALAPSPVERPMRDTVAKAEAASGRGIEVWPDSVKAQAIYGPHTAIGEAIVRAFDDPGTGFVLVSDEDQVVSDDILDYLTFARQQDVVAVNCRNNMGQGWSPRWDDTDADQELVTIVPEFSGYTWGVPRAAWTELWLPEWDWDCTSGDDPMQHGFDWQNHRIANRGYRLAMPEASRVQNIGQYGGTYAHPDQYFWTVARSFREHRDPVYRLATGD